MPIPPGFDAAAFFCSYTQKTFVNELKVERRTYHWLKSLTLADVRAWRPCDKKWTRADQENQLRDIRSFLQQPHEETTEAGGGWVSVFERVRPSMSGFPARFYSPGARLFGPVRANVLEHTADMDMSIAMQRTTRWVCALFDVECGTVVHYIEHRDQVLQQFMDDMGCTKKHAKEAFQIPLTWSQKMHGVRNEFHRRYDAEGKRIQQALMKVPELQWMLPHCKEDNRAGSFVAHLYQFIESKLLMAVAAHTASPVHLHVYDGLNLADKSLFGTQPPLDDARAVCETVAPGINMIWAWKPPDFTIRSKDKKQDIGELHVPDDFVADAAEDGDEADVELGPTEPTYEELHEAFSATHKKVGSTYVDLTKEAGRITLMDPRHFINEYRHMVYYELEQVEVKNPRTSKKVAKKEIREHPFIEKWMRDKRMDPIYLVDKSARYYFKYFGMFPKPELCPADCYNNWQGFAVHDTPPADLAAAAKGAAKTVAGLLAFLEHLSMLVSGNVEQYNFLLDLLAHTMQYPNVKLGIMICLVGVQGTGKTMVWEMVKRLIGKAASFETDQPQRDVWGDNNSKMINAFFVRITEADKKKFKGYVGEMRTKITDEEIRVRSLYCEAANVRSYARFFCDTNYPDAIPDEHGERRFFVVLCATARVGDNAYFARLKAIIEDDAVVRAFYDFLMRRTIKPMYLGKDIPVGDFQRRLKDANRSGTDSFVQHLVSDQDLKKTEVVMSAQQVYAAYCTWQEGGKEYERSKCGILKELSLNALGGITSCVQRYAVELGMEEDFRTVQRLQTVYKFDLGVLRRRYGLDKLVAEMQAEEGGAQRAPADIRDRFVMDAPAPAPRIDCEQDIRNAFPEVTLPFDVPHDAEEGGAPGALGAPGAPDGGGAQGAPSPADDSEDDEAQQDSPLSRVHRKRGRDE